NWGEALSLRRMKMRVVPVLAICAIAFCNAASAQEIDWKKVDEALGRTAAVSGDAHRYGFPRSDLQVTLDGVTIRPALALGGWVAFKPAQGGAMIMGDLVLLETEINPVMTKLIENGIEITALHNHVLRATPATFYMHVGGHGDAVKLASAIRSALAESKTPLSPPAPAATQPAIDLETAQLDQSSGANGGPLDTSASRPAVPSCTEVLLYKIERQRHRMQTRKIRLSFLLPGVLLFAAQATAEPTFRKLAGKQIAAEIAGMELTDQSHW